MSFVLLPCEIYHREFDAKLILASHLASKYGISSIIGYDKHFPPLARSLKGCTLMDKSCSSIMWNTRLKPVLENSGSVIVSDEEGFNNITDSNYSTWASRLDLTAAQSINTYACWGKIDMDFFSKFSQLRSKINVLGNCRSDLVNKLGRSLYYDLSQSLVKTFGNYILCSDNFCVEHREGAYLPPVFDKPSIENDKARYEFVSRQKSQSSRRDIFASYLEHAARKNPSINFIIRPHPCSDHRWWSHKFWNLRNVHILYLHNVDPWLHGAKALISMGCTTSLQSIIASVPVIEILDHSTNDLESQNLGFGHLYTRLHASTLQDFMSCLKLAFNSPQESFTNITDFELNWHNSLYCSSSSVFAAHIQSLSPSVCSNYIADNLQILSQYSAHRSKNPLLTNSTKWFPTSLDLVNTLHHSICKSFNLRASKIGKVCRDLYFIQASDDNSI